MTQAFFKTRGRLNSSTIYPAHQNVNSMVTPQEEDKVVEAMEELRINYNLRQWRVCSLICESLADKFKAIANSEK